MGSRLPADALSLQEPRETTERIVRFLRTHVERTGAQNLVVGMSGGLDSSVAAVLCSMAVGGKKTLGFSLTEEDTRNPKSLRDAEEVARGHAIQFKSLDITPLVKTAVSLVRATPTRNSVPLGNIKARLRAMILYYYSNTNNGLVVGTGDKSENMLGYFTKYGDGASDIQPLADLYKTTLRGLAKHLRLPSRIYFKPPSPELWPGQTAEEELGLPYDQLDQILWALERWLPTKDVSRDLGISLNTIEKIRKRWVQAEHKRRPPLTIKLGFRTSGQDLRLPHEITK